jgi:hypothetical protein
LAGVSGGRGVSARGKQAVESLGNGIETDDIFFENSLDIISISFIIRDTHKNYFLGG